MSVDFLMKENAFNCFLRPLLKDKKLDRNNLDYYYNQGFRCWAMDFKKGDILKVKEIEKLCNELFLLNKPLSFDIFSYMIENLLDNRQILEKELGKKDKDYKDLFNLYKALYENELKVWSTPLFALICEKNCGKKIGTNKIKRLPSGANYFNVGTSSKLFHMEDLTYGFPLLVKGIDRLIRNAGSGHNSYEILDNGKCKLKDISPKTGEENGVLEVTKADLEKELKKFEKLLLIFDLGVNIFIENNEDIKNHIIKSSNRERKISEIEKNIGVVANNFQLEILKFNFSLDRKKLILHIKNRYISTGIGVGKFYTERGGGDIVTKKRQVKYIENIFALVFEVLCLNQEKTFALNLEIFDTNSELLYKGNFYAEEIGKLLHKGKKIYPIPEEGNLPEHKYELKEQLQVPDGAGEEIDLVVNNPLFNKDAYLKTMAKFMGIKL